MRTVQVTIKDEVKEYITGTSYEQIAKEYQKNYDSKILLVTVDGKLNELHKMVGKDCQVDFVTMTDKAGFETYRRSAIFIMIKAITDVVGKDKIDHIKVEFSVDKSFYCTASGDFELDESFIRCVKARMDEIVEQNIPIWKSSYSLGEAVELFSKAGMKDKEKLFKYRRASKVNVYSLGEYQDYYYGYMAPSTGYITDYDLDLYDEGFVLMLPTKKEPNVIKEFVPQEKLFNVMKNSTEWGVKMGVETVGDLNDKICQGAMQEIMLVQEAVQEAQVASIAQDIVEKGGKKFIMIAGPSSSGKTSFSHRLSIQLRAHGLIPHTIALDNYFKNREDTPKDADGNYDFECLEAIDVEGFNRDMNALLAGETVELPTFNFKIGKREYKGDYRRLDEDDVLVIEGIHGLNEKMSYSLPKESKYKIYISALTVLNVDEHNRIRTTDLRLIRRMVRDFRSRGTSAKGTLAMWDSVRRGEEKYIFPYQESADAVFNSALIYELSVLKQFAEPLLFGIKKGEPEYLEAKRLLKFLDYFIGVTSEGIPNNSLLREFVGGSIFNV